MLKSGWIVVALFGAAVSGAGCAFPPWSMGAPLDGRPSIPATTEAPSIPSLRALAVAQRAAGHPALELRALDTIARAERLKADERERVVPLLEERARELLALGRAVPACEDLRELEELAPARARALARVHAAAERDGGDAWLSVGDVTRAREAYEIAASLGAADTDFRLAATAEPPARVEPGVAERAVLELPLRAVPPFAEIYLAGGAAAGVSETDPTIRRAALARAWRAARQERVRPLADRLQALLAGAGPGSAPSEATPLRPGATDTERLANALLDAPLAPADARPPDNASELDNWVVGSAAVSTRLIPLLEVRPLPPGATDSRAALLAPGDRSRRWAELLLEEDPTSTDVLELTAEIDGLAGRIGGAERKLVDLVYFTPDRYQGLVRAARRLGAGGAGAPVVRGLAARGALARRGGRRGVGPRNRVHAARPGRGELALGPRLCAGSDAARAPRRGRGRAGPGEASSVAPPARALGAAVGAPVSDRPAGAPIPCDTGGSPR